MRARDHRSQLRDEGVFKGVEGERVGERRLHPQHLCNDATSHPKHKNKKTVMKRNL